jgi:NitT/TauT family transport system substrate-binding protein
MIWRALALAAVVGLGGCERPATPAARQPFRIAIDLWAGYYPLVIADERGLLRSAGLTLDLAVPNDTKRMIADFAAGRYDGICVSLADTILLAQSASDIRMILNTDESSGADVILSRTPIAGPEAIRGQRIATNLGGFGELLVRRFLDRHHVTTDEVILVNADAAAVPGLLARGEIGIALTWEPYAAEARRAGAIEVFSSRDTPGLILDGLIMQGSILRDRPAEVRALLRAWFEALDWWRKNPDAGDALVERRLALSPGAARPVGVRLIDLAENHRNFQPNAPAPTLASALHDYTEFFVARGMINRRPTAAQLIDGRFLP